MKPPEDTDASSNPGWKRRFKLFGISFGTALLLGLACETLLNRERVEDLIVFQDRAYAATRAYTPWGMASSYWNQIWHPEIIQSQQSTPWQDLIDDADATARSASEFSQRWNAAKDGNFLPESPTPNPEPQEGARFPGNKDAVAKLRALYWGPTINLSGMFPIYVRPLTAIVDVFVRLYFSQGIVGFVISSLQLVMGCACMYLVAKRYPQMELLRHPLCFVPGAVALGSLAAVPIWIFALVSLAVMGSVLWLAGLAAQATGYLFGLSWLGLKVSEHLGHAALMKRLRP